MTRYFLPVLIAALLISFKPQHEKNRILFVATNIDQMNGNPNGTYLIELAVPFDLFGQNGFEMDIVSPQGGKIPVYHSGDTNDAVKKVLETEKYIYKTANSLKPDEVDPGHYSAVIIPGGYGQFWDLHQNGTILKLIADIHASGGVVGSLGHGTAILSQVKQSSGGYWVLGKTLTCFPTEVERNYMKQSAYGMVLPFDMETELVKAGANLKIYNPVTKENQEWVDVPNRLVTASFATGGEFVAMKMMELLHAHNHD